MSREPSNPVSSFVGRLMNFIVSGYVHVVTLTLLVYMLATLLEGLQFIGVSLFQLEFLTGNLAEDMTRAEMQAGLLHTIAFAIVLVKAYKILVSYADTHHINLKYLIEIAIIAPTVELLFNSFSYSLGMNILFGLFAFGNMVLYLFFYPRLKEVSKDYDKLPSPLTKKPRKKKVE